MSDAHPLPDQWREHPEVKALVTQAVKEARDALAPYVKQLETELTARKRQDTASNGRNDNDGETPPPSDTSEKHPAQNQVQRLQERIKALETELQTKDRRLAQEVLERGIREAVANVGEVHKDAWADVIARGKSVFSIDEHGCPVARDTSNNALYAADGVTPMDFAQWARNLLADAPHLFKAAGNNGSGATGGGNNEQPGRNVVISKEQARNPITYRRAKERAAKLGSELLIQ